MDRSEVVFVLREREGSREGLILHIQFIFICILHFNLLFVQYSVILLPFRLFAIVALP